MKRAKESLSNLVLSVSHTTRSPRTGEKNGEDYYFISEGQFREMIENGDFLEWAKVHGNYYGTSKNHIYDLLNKGKLVVLDIDVQGAMQIRGVKEIRACFIFIEPPSLQELRHRLENRASESDASLRKRIENAEQELAFKNRYDFVIMNDDLDRAVKEFVEILSRDE